MSTRGQGSHCGEMGEQGPAPGEAVEGAPFCWTPETHVGTSEVFIPGQVLETLTENF